MLKAFDTFQYLCFTFPNLLENYIQPYLSFIWIWSFLVCIYLLHMSKNLGKITKKLNFIIHKNVLLKEKFSKMFRGHSIFNTGLWRINSFSNKKQPGRGAFKYLKLSRWDEYFSLTASPSVRVCVSVWGIINYSFAEVYLALQYRAIYHRNKCWENITIATALSSFLLIHL